MTVNKASSTFRHNLCTNPGAAVNTLGYAVSPGTSGTAAITQSADSTAPSGSGQTAVATWSVAATAANANMYQGTLSSTAPSMPVTPGSAYSGGCWLKTSMNGLTFQVAIYFYNSASTFLGSVVGSSVASTTANQWVWLSVANAVAPATATQMVVIAVQGGSTPLPVNATLAMGGVIAEQATTEPGYFDGEHANGSWDGAYGASTSTLLVPAGLNPTWPVMGWKVWTGEGFPGANNPSTVPVVISDRVRSFKVERGRQYELDQDQTGTAELTAENNDGALVGGLNNMFPGRMAQMKVTYQGVTYPLFTGYVSSWPDKASDPATAVSNMRFVDLMDALSNRPLHSMYRETVMAMSPQPSHYFPFDEPAGDPTILNSVGAIDVMSATATISPYPINPYKGGDPGTLVFGSSGFGVHDGTTSLHNDNASGVAGKASQVLLGTPWRRQSITVDTSNPWMALLLLKATAGASAVFSILDRYGSEYASIYFSVPSQTVTFVVGGLSTAVTVSTASLAAGVQVGVGYNGGNAFYVLNGASVLVAGTPTLGGVLSWIAAGASFSGTTIYHGSQSTYWLQNLAVWGAGSIPSITSTGPLKNSYNAFANAYLYSSPVGGSSSALDSAAARVARILRWAGYTMPLVTDAPAFNVDSMPDTRGSGALDAIRAAVLSVWGRFFINKAGNPTFYSKDWKQSTVKPAITFGSRTDLGELPYTGAPDFEYDLAHVYNDVEVSTTSSLVDGSFVPSTYNPGSTSAKGATYKWINTASVGKYLTRVLQSSMGLLFGSDANSFAQWLSNRYGEPDYRIGEVVLEPAKNPALWTACLGLELGDLVTVNHRDVNGLHAGSGVFQVAKITHEGDAWSWVTRLQLVPFHQYWLLAAMHAFTNAAYAAGVTSISITPLPDSATNPAEASIGVGTTLQLDPGTVNAETVTVTSVTSVPTAKTTGYTSITLGVSATTKPHGVNAVICDPLPSNVTDPTTWDSRSVLGTTTILNV